MYHTDKVDAADVKKLSLSHRVSKFQSVMNIREQLVRRRRRKAITIWRSFKILWNNKNPLGSPDKQAVHKQQGAVVPTVWALAEASGADCGSP